ncbi:MAG: PDZ domain-containing protein, partial [Phycisphaerae bacterium]|nr:PDZ domain-containing protein [Phycisphaerae bacterium]
REVTAALIEHGEVERSYIGMSVRSIKDTGLERGVLVNSVVGGGPSDKAGIKAGDVILKIDGELVTVRFVEEIPPLIKRIASLPVGSTVKYEYERDGVAGEAVITTEKLKKDVGDENVFRAWGLTAMAITEKMARDRRLDSTAGVLVSGTRSGGSAELAEPALRRGDVIRAIDGQPIADLGEFIDRYGAIMDLDPLPDFMLVEFDRNGESQVTLVKPKPDKDEDPPRELPKAWIGVATQPVLQNLADKLGLAGQRGYRITRVYPYTTAAETDLQVGDVIVKLNGEVIQPNAVQDIGLFARSVRRLDIGNTAKLTVIRDGAETEIEVPLERTRIDTAEARRDRNRDFDLTVREVTFFDRDARRWEPDVDGMLVEDVEGGGWASRGGLSPGDLIQRINGYEVTGLKSYRKAMEKIVAEQPERVVFVVLRGVDTSFLFVEPDWKPLKDSETGASNADEKE